MSKSAFASCAQFFSDRPLVPKFEEELHLGVNANALKGLLMREGHKFSTGGREVYEIKGGSFCCITADTVTPLAHSSDIKKLILKHAQVPMLLLGLTISKPPVYDFRNHCFSMSFSPELRPPVERLGNWSTL